jgi:RNA polymerase sigma factor (sigma-70 family)
MILIEESQILMNKFIELRRIAAETNDPKDVAQFKKHENLCINKFMYLIFMRTAKYKKFSNYEDLNQEGFEALIKAMKNYNPKKGNFFWWSHKYIGTRISRSANLHTTIRYPLKIAKATPPHKEAIMPLIIEERYCPDKELESTELKTAIGGAMSFLTKDQVDVINLVFGFDGDKPMSINKVCNKLNITRLNCIKTINSALSTMKESIKI